MVSACNPSIHEAKAGGSELKTRFGYIEKPCLKKKSSCPFRLLTPSLKIYPRKTIKANAIMNLRKLSVTPQIVRMLQGDKRHL
jgi:hypothetical protein